MGRIWKAAELLGCPFGPYVRLLALAAQRRTAVAAMRWGDLDLDAAMWIIPAANNKSERNHFVPLTPTTVDIVKVLPRLGFYVLTTDGRTHPMNFAKLTSRLAAFIADYPRTFQNLVRNFFLAFWVAVGTVSADHVVALIKGP